MKYKIGDKVWFAQRKSVTKTENCPDCFGKRYLTVIKGDDSQVTIECAGCQSGYEPPKGYISYYSQDIDVNEVVIEGLDVRPLSEPEYRFNCTECSWRSAKEDELFTTKEEAEIKAKELSDEWNKEQLGRIHQKEKHNRTWSWNAHYHRDCIKRAERDLEYHRNKLDYAKLCVKESK